MAFSYSFHLSSKGHAISTVAKVGQTSRHNLRDYKSSSYDRNEIHVLAGGEKSILQNMKEIYHREFDEALAKYNKGKRTDRQIGDYLTHISNAKADVGAELIIQVGDKDFWKGIEKADWKKMDSLFERQLEELQKLVPEFKIASAVVHYDESSPHLHVVGVPVSSGFKKGLERQVSKTRVFTADRLSYLQDKMRENAENCMKEYQELFKNARLKEKEKGRNKDIPKESLDEYYALRNDIADQRKEAEFWKEQNELYMDKAFESRDEAAGLDEENQKLKKELLDNKERLERQTGELKRIDAVSRLLSKEEEPPVLDFTIPEKKGIFGRVESPGKQGAFIEGMDKEQVSAIIRRARTEEGLLQAYERVKAHSSEILEKAKEDARSILDEATAEKNETVAKAQDIVNQQHSIIQKAREWADSLKKKYKELADRFNDLLKRKTGLEQEIDRLEATRGDLEPLRHEIEELSRARQIMAGKLDYELTRAKFKDWSEMKYGTSYDEYRKRGELLALYKDGSVRLVGSNERGGWDDQTLADQKKGLCRVGIMLDEERVNVPKPLLKELIQARDREKPISEHLQNLIQQQSDVERTVSKIRKR